MPPTLVKSNLKTPKSYLVLEEKYCIYDLYNMLLGHKFISIASVLSDAVCMIVSVHVQSKLFSF
jgi:hypothetical protein